MFDCIAGYSRYLHSFPTRLSSDLTSDVAVADLVAALDEAAGDDVWAYVPTPAALLDPAVQPGTDVIMNAIVYRTDARSEEHTSELQSRPHLVCRLLLEKKNNCYTT